MVHSRISCFIDGASTIFLSTGETINQATGSCCTVILTSFIQKYFLTLSPRNGTFTVPSLYNGLLTFFALNQLLIGCTKKEQIFILKTVTSSAAAVIRKFPLLLQFAFSVFSVGVFKSGSASGRVKDVESCSVTTPRDWYST